MAKVSVCIPVYNAEKTVRETLESVVLQTERDWELIIQDNASTDGSLAVIDEFVVCHPERDIRVIRKKITAPPEENWQACIREAKSKWIKLLFADDILYPQCLEWQLSCAEANPGIVLVSNRRDLISQTGRTLARASGLGRLKGKFTITQLVNEILRTGRNPLGEPEAVLFSRAASESVPGFTSDNPYVVDLDYWVQILRLGEGFADLRVAGAFRINGSSISVRLLRRQSGLFLAFLRQLQAHGLIRSGSLPIARAAVLGFLHAMARGAVYAFVRIFP